MCRTKKESTLERYLDLIPAVEQRSALTKLRTSLHNLEIKQGRYVTSRLRPGQRLCGTYHVIDDGMHFVTKSRNNACKHKSFFLEDLIFYPDFITLGDKNKFVYLVKGQDQRALRWLGKLLYNSFNIRNEILHTSSLCILYI